MDRGRVILQSLMGKLEGSSERIRRATYAELVVFEARPTGEFSVVVSWKTPQDETRQHTIDFSLSFVLGDTLTLDPGRWVARETTCGFRRLIVGEVLAKRGAL